MKLQSSPFAGLAFVAWSHAATVTVKAGGSTNLVYEPAMATASPGDVMEFHFLAHNHSAIMGEFGNPCMPAGDGKGFSSGFWPVSAGENVRLPPIVPAKAEPVLPS
jgi:plastocyanin